MTNSLQMFHGGKNLIVFAVAFGVVPWIHLNGIAAVFGILAAMTIVIDLGWVILYVFGARLRQLDVNKAIFPY